ncbi:MAG TPA: hypothetical protein VKF40_03465 [Burkholderiales bacterium]|nr:hypothetical protein [Burkholderiales bacterium]
MTATYWQVDATEATTSYYEQALNLMSKLQLKRFEVVAQPLAAASDATLGRGSAAQRS